MIFVDLIQIILFRLKIVNDSLFLIFYILKYGINFIFDLEN